jgi:hypothetical protein
VNLNCKLKLQAFTTKLETPMLIHIHTMLMPDRWEE